MIATVAETVPVGTVRSASGPLIRSRPADYRSRRRQLMGFVQDAFEALVIVWTIPFVILLVSAPLVLALALLVRLGTWALNAH